MTAIRIDAHGVSHTGLVRSVNEDGLLLDTAAGLWAVADGMGGHTGGRFASEALVQILSEIGAGHDMDALAAAVARAVHAANAAIFAKAADGARMGSTIVALLVVDGAFACLWAGDSRAYLLRDGRLFRLTRDHTQVQEMVEAGVLTAQEAQGHPMSHVLSRAVGVEPELQLDAVRDTVRPRDVFLLCSDGLTGLVSDAEIAERLARHEPASATQSLLDLVLSRGASDNVTLIALACQEATILSLAPAGSPP